MALVSWIGSRVAGIARRSGFSLYATIRGPGPTKGLRMELEGAKLRQLSGRHDLSVQNCIAERFRPGGCFIDVGAEVGFFSLLAAKLAGQGGRVIAIEPVPAKAELIKVNATLNNFDNVTIVTAAAGAVNRTGATIQAHRPVPVLTVDGLVSHLRLPPPSMVRIDVEGAEIEVLAGMPDTLWRHHPDILFEIDAQSVDEAALRYAKTSEALTHYGYEVRRLEDADPGENGAVVHGIGVFE